MDGWLGPEIIRHLGQGDVLGQSTGARVWPACGLSVPQELPLCGPRVARVTPAALAPGSGGQGGPQPLPAFPLCSEEWSTCDCECDVRNVMIRQPCPSWINFQDQMVNLPITSHR